MPQVVLPQAKCLLKKAMWLEANYHSFIKYFRKETLVRKVKISGRIACTLEVISKKLYKVLPPLCTWRMKDIWRSLLYALYCCVLLMFDISLKSFLNFMNIFGCSGGSL